jgi:hypothetical protein
MTRLLMILLVFASAGYTAFMLWMVWFTFAMFGPDMRLAPLAGVLAFGLAALSPVAVCICCGQRVQALLRGERSGA